MCVEFSKNVRHKEGTQLQNLKEVMNQSLKEYAHFALPLERMLESLK